MCLFAGGYTTYYWQAAAWTAVIHNPFEQTDDFYKPHFNYFTYMRQLMDQVHFENCKPIPGYNGAGYNLTNKKDGIVLMYAPKESHWVSANAAINKEFDYSEANYQWFNTLTGEFTEEKPFTMKEIGFWDWRPWRYEADAVLIVKNLKSK
jgi:hypothetical protein